jgi:hypothetical protein
MAYASQELKKELSPQIKAVLKKYWIKGTLSVQDHATLTCNIRSWVIDFASDYIVDPRSEFDKPFETYKSVNEKFIDSSWDGKAKDFLLDLKSAMMKWNHNNNDLQTDYFDVGWYINIKIGHREKPYKLIN